MANNITRIKGVNEYVASEILENIQKNNVIDKIEIILGENGKIKYNVYLK